MNLKAIIASLVLGSSSVALAEPALTVSAPSVTVSATIHATSGYRAPVVRERRYTQRPPILQPAPVVVTQSPPIWNPTPVVTHSPPIWNPAPRSVTLAQNLAFAADGRKFITVGAEAGSFKALTIEASGGRTFIKQVYVQFDNGQEQVVRNLDRTLVGNASLTLDLDGNRRAIRRIVVYGTNLDNGIRHEANAFTVTAL